MVFKHTIPVRLLRQVESENPDERLQALKEIIRRRVRRSDIEPILNNLAKDHDDRIRKEVLEASVKFLGEDALPQLLDALRDQSSSVRKTAVILLRSLNYRSIHDRIEPLLADPDLEVKLEALRTIVHLRDLAALETLIDVLKETYDPKIMDTAVEQLKSLIKSNVNHFFQFWYLHPNEMKTFLQKKEISVPLFDALGDELIKSAKTLLENHSVLVRTIKEQLEEIIPDHSFTRGLGKVVDAHLLEQRQTLQRYGINIRPQLIEGFPGSEEQIIIECFGLLIKSLRLDPDSVLSIKDELIFPVRDRLSFTCQIVEKSLQPSEHDVALLVDVETTKKESFTLALKIPVKNHGLIGLDDHAKKVLKYLKRNPKPTFEDLLISLEIPSMLLSPIFTYLNHQVDLDIGNLVLKEYLYHDEISRRLLKLKPNAREFSLLDLPEVEDDRIQITIADFKKSLQFLGMFTKAEHRDLVDVLAEGSTHLEQLSRYSMRLYMLLEFGKKKKKVDEVARELGVGPWTTLRIWKYFDELRDEHVTFESELHRTIDFDTTRRLNELGRSFSIRNLEELSLDEYFDHHRFMYMLSNWRFIPLDWFASHITRDLLDEVNRITQPLSDLLLDKKKVTFSNLFQKLQDQVPDASPLALALFLKLHDEFIEWSPQFISFVKESLLSLVQLDLDFFDDAILTLADHVEDPRRIPLLSSLLDVKIGLVDVILLRYSYDSLLSSEPRELGHPPAEVLHQVMRWITEEEATSLWQLLRKWYLLKKEGLLVPKDVVLVTLSSMLLFNEEYTIHQLDLTQLSMKERLELNQQAIRVLKVLKEHDRPMTPVELARTCDITPSRLMKVLSYAYSTSELRPLLEKHSKYLIVSSNQVTQDISRLQFVQDLRMEIKVDPLPRLNEIELKSAKIKIKIPRFSFDWLS